MKQILYIPAKNLPNLLVTARRQLVITRALFHLEYL